MATTNPTTRIVIGLLIAAGILEGAVCVAAYSRGIRQAKAASIKASNESEAALAQTEAARKDEADKCATAARESAELQKKLDRLKDQFDEQAEKCAAAEKETSRLRSELDTAKTRIVDLTRILNEAEARAKRAELSLADSQDAERRARLKATAVTEEKRVAVAPAAAVIDQADRGGKKHGHKNGGNQVATKKRRGGVASLPRTTPSFSELDTNQDGRISYEEYKVGYPDATEADFKAADTNGDGALSIEEYKAAHPDPALVHVTRKKN